ncbi:MAG: PPC domain-containing protein [Planctomycetes bacterium]|nr:PPC domain-containing protein [Planctomycetota bacterium]
MQRLLACSVLAMALATTEYSSAQVFIESVFPPSIQRGEVNRVTVRGVNMLGATDLWLTLPGQTFEAQQVTDSTATEATFEIEVATDAPLGLYGLRLATRDGLSNAHIFAIDQLRPIAENEAIDSVVPNNKREQAQDVVLPAAVFGSCTDADLDYFAFDVAASETVAFEVVGNRLGKAFDPVVTIFKENGQFVAEHDNDVGLFFDCRFQHTFKEPGRHIIRVQDTRFLGSPNWTYVLRMGSFPVARVAFPSTAARGEQLLVDFPQTDCGPREFAFPEALSADRFFISLRGDNHNAPTWLPLAVSSLPNTVESEPNDSQTEATTAMIPGNLHGIMNRRGDGDFFAFDLKEGQRLEFRSDTRDSGSAADLELTLFGPDGKNLKTIDDVGFEDAAFEFSAPADGRYTLKAVEVVRKHGPEYVYRIEVKERQPSISLTSEIGRIAIPQGTWQPLLLKLDRKDFNGEVKLELVGAPEGMMLRESVIDEGALTGGLLVDESTPAGIYTLQVVGTAVHNDMELRSVARTQPIIDRLPTGRGPHGEPFELREDQRRLPPSLTDRIAVVVLPKSPYNFEVKSQLVTLPRYLETTFEIETTRAAGFDAPITFVARGGQLEQNRLRKPSIIQNIPDAKRDSSLVVASLHSGVNTTLAKQRVALTGTAVLDGRTINLTRTFEVEIKVAFAVAVEPKKLELHPGDDARVKLLANRLAPYNGELRIAPGQIEGIQFPEEVVIPDAASEVELKLTIAADAKPGTYKIKLPTETRIDKFFESAEGEALEIVVTEKEEAAEEAGE